MLIFNNLKSKTSVNFIYYFISLGLSKAFYFLLLPIFSYYLSPEDFGMWSFFLLYLALFMALIGMMSSSKISKNFFKSNDHPEVKPFLVTGYRDHVSSIISHLVGLYVLHTILYTLIIGIIMLKTNDLFSMPINILIFIPLICFFKLIIEVYQVILRHQNKALSYLKLSALMMGIELLLMGLFVIILSYNWDGLIKAVFLSNMIVFLFCIYKISAKYDIRFIFDTVVFKKIVFYSFPLLIYGVFGMLIQYIDRFFIEYYINLEAVGLYSMVYSFSLGLLLFREVFNYIWGPWCMKQFSEDLKISFSSFLKRSVGISVLFMFIGILFLILSKYWLFEYLINDNYIIAKSCLDYIIVATILQSFCAIFQPILLYKNKTLILALINFLVVLINIIGNIIWIPINGYVGAAQATLLAIVVQTASVIYYALFILLKYKREVRWL